MNQQRYILRFDDMLPSEASRFTEELRNALLDATLHIDVQPQLNDSRAQSFGTELVIILGAPATLVIGKAIGKAISNWLALRRSTITIEAEKGEITKISGINLTQEMQQKILEIFTKSEKSSEDE